MEAGGGSGHLLSDRIAKAIADFAAQLGSSKVGILTQAWMPEAGDDGCIVLNTQGLPFCVNGAGDLLALFRCISCKYKFSTDTTKPWLMGPVGRVYTSGEPELTHNVQKYDQTVYLRIAEAQRCQVNSCLFLPVYSTEERDQAAAVLEIVQTENNVIFAAIVDWMRVCLEGSGLWTTDADKDSLAVGLRSIHAAPDASAFESKVEALAGTFKAGNASEAPNHSLSMPPPVAPSGLKQTSSHTFTGSAQVQALRQAASGEEHSDAALAAQGLAATMQNQTTMPTNNETGPSGVHQTQQGFMNGGAAAYPHSLPPRPAPSGAATRSGGGGGSAAAAAATAAAAAPFPQEDLGTGRAYGRGGSSLTLEDLAPHFHLSMKDAAGKLEMGLTTLKRVCRHLGLQRWPRRELALQSRGTDGAPLSLALQGSLASGQSLSAGSSGELASGANAPPGGGSVAGMLPPLNVSAVAAVVAAAAAGAANGDGVTLNVQANQHRQQPQWYAPVPAGLHSHGGGLDECGTIDGQGMESLDILAAADFDVSVGNSPHAAGGFHTSSGAFDSVMNAFPGH